MAETDDSLSKALHRYSDREVLVATPPMPSESAIAAFGSLVSVQQLTSKLDGSHGTNRAKVSTIGTQVNTDLLAAVQFIQGYEDRQNTYLAYRTEIARFMRWAIVEQEIPVSSLSMSDIGYYARFIMQPPSDWCAPRRRVAKRRTSAWQPFIGDPSDKTVIRAMHAINAFYVWGVRVQYFQANPVAMFRSIKRLVLTTRANVLKKDPLSLGESDAQSRLRSANVDGRVDASHRHLHPKAVDAIKQALASLPVDTELRRLECERAIFLITLLYCTGTRAGVVVTATMGDINCIYGDLWVWKVTDKGGKTREIPLTDELMKALARYRQAFGLSPHPISGDRTPLLLKISFLSQRRHARKAAKKGKKSAPIRYKHISHHRLNQILDDLGSRAVEIVKAMKDFENKSEILDQLQSQSAHWWRHTAGTDLGNQNMSLGDIQTLLGHASSDTTRIYVHGDTKRLRDMMNAMLEFGFESR